MFAAYYDGLGGVRSLSLRHGGEFTCEISDVIENTSEKILLICRERRFIGREVHLAHSEFEHSLDGG